MFRGRRSVASQDLVTCGVEPQQASTVAGDALDAVLGSSPRPVRSPRLELNPDYRPTAKEIEANLVDRTRRLSAGRPSLHSLSHPVGPFGDGV